MEYNVILDLKLVLPKIKHLKIKLGKFDKPMPVISIEADDPDDACYLAFKAFYDHVIGQSSTFETKELLKEIKYDFIVTNLLLQQ